MILALGLGTFCAETKKEHFPFMPPSHVVISVPVGRGGSKIREIENKSGARLKV